ncbi:MAG TPA: sugar ABC transporter substrate-binding protein, partial [Planctomycetaceae bacterium]|nr:sugar ABC transporter substrate-binding protein [Planctomycetaceae bacterium]
MLGTGDQQALRSVPGWLAIGAGAARDGAKGLNRARLMSRSAGIVSRLSFRALVAASVIAFAAGCVRYDSSVDEVRGKAVRQDEEVLIGLTLMTYNNPFFIALRDAAKAEAQRHGASLLENDAGYDIARQTAAIEDFLNQGVDLILLNPVDSKAIVRAVELANERGVPVICVDVKAEGGKLATFIASDNEKLGMLTGEYIAKRLGGKGKVAIIGHPFVSSGLHRQIGLKKVLAKYPAIEIVAEQPCQGDRTKANEVAENILLAHPDVDAIWAINDPSALGAMA